ncbi:probable RNA helicase armi isoform X2 [Hyposmocoma kahamanoa]|nr:probable RNA helicase armi isoform X2 [Hyposmocoma kahamanoa]
MPSVPKTIPRNTECFQRTGVITYLSEDCVLIDGMLFFDSTFCSITLSLNDKVLYLGYIDKKDSIVVVRILENLGLAWSEKEEVHESSYKVIEHVIVGEVSRREDRFVLMKDGDLKFSLDDVEATFVPVKGDWLELKCTMQFDEENPTDISAAQVLQVIAFRALRTKIKSGKVTDWLGQSGRCDGNIYFDEHSFETSFIPKVGNKVMVEAIESNQGTCSWRALKLVIVDSNIKQVNKSQTTEENDVTLKVEQDKNIAFTYPIKFENVNYQSTEKITLSITNNSNEVYIMNKWIVLSKKRDSQIDIKPFLTRPTRLYPKQTISFNVTCYPKFLGNSKECLIVMFRGFQLKRFIEINVVNNNDECSGIIDNYINTCKSEKEKISKMRDIRKSENTFIPGVKVLKPPAFIPVKLGIFPIPEKIWSAVLGDSEQTVHGTDYIKILDRIESTLPYLLKELSTENYVNKWHTLLYMEEIQHNINIRVYDMKTTFLIRCQEYLAIEISGLSERRPSLMKGDRALVKDVWDTNSPKYEGYIHNILGDLVLMKFNQRFHETYSGSDVSLEFHFSRSTYRRQHQAISLAFSNLGSEILFPRKILSRTPQMPLECVKAIKWYNEKLNNGQKAAVTNILAGECRPLPYCIFGPPGTGKTVTIIETILQILAHIPDSRILIATPSNSAANLITERLIENRNSFTGSVVRLIASYLVDNDNIPEKIKPFCATMDIAKESTAKSKHNVADGIQMHCQTSFIGRHRVTIGTCICLGVLAQMGLPKGHFTHIIVDEAGQALEPEIMIPLTFIDKENGQIVLAGDPMQLGPVVLSKYCKEYGMDISYLERLLNTFPYQKDFDAFHDGFNHKLITKLNDNYRSLEETLKLSSEIFYDGSLVPKLDRQEQWVLKTISVINEVMNSPDQDTGGIYVFGIKGHNMRAKDSPSWYNPQEASMVALTACKLFKRNVSANDIGIITPYIAQMKYLRVLFEGMGLPQPKIGTVEEFQGQERPIILMSTVRSTKSLLVEDHKHTLGFVQNSKRLNVALTRAQIAIIIFCNPHLLNTDPQWNKIVEYSVKEDKYMGCDLPSDYDSNTNKSVED